MNASRVQGAAVAALLPYQAIRISAICTGVLELLASRATPDPSVVPSQSRHRTVSHAPRTLQKPRPGWPGSGPIIGRPGKRSVAVPILERAPAAMRRRAGIISGTSGITRLPAAALPWGGAGEDEAAANPRHGHGVDGREPDSTWLVRNFRAPVSSASYQLAGYLSAAPLTFPVMRLVQESMIPETGSAGLAEVFLSGLLRRSADSDPATDAESVSCVFAAGVRGVLQSTLTRDEALAVPDQVGNHLFRRRGGRPFPVLLRGRPAEQFPATFGRIAGPLLDRIIGPFANDIRRRATRTTPASDVTRRVFVVHGRDGLLTGRIKGLLYSVGLKPLEWEELVQASGSTAPYLGQVVAKAPHLAQATLVLLSPDDVVELHPDLYQDNDLPYERARSLQARPNVLFEFGLAVMAYPERTIVIDVGQMRPIADLAGLNVIRFDGSTMAVKKVLDRLRQAGCPVDDSGTDWLAHDRFADLTAYSRGPETRQRAQ